MTRGRHRQPIVRRRRDLQRQIAEQQDYIDLCEKTISQLCNENDDLRKIVGWPESGSEDDTVILPAVEPIMPVVTELTPPTHTIPIVMPDGTVLRTESGTRKVKRPSWARQD